MKTVNDYWSAERFRRLFTTRMNTLILSLLLLGTVAIGAQERPNCRTGDARVDALLSKMSLQEKIGLLHGSDEPAPTFQGQAGYLPGLPRIGIPGLRLADGPPGVLTRVPAAAPTATMGLAATFDLQVAEQNGELIGRDARARGIDVVLQPFINIDRDLKFSRGYNTFGEDPFLTGKMGASEIRGIQRLGVMAQAKHYIGYDSPGENIYIDDQTLHEVYLAPFAAASEAGVSSIMCSYNKINGVAACGNRNTLTTMLRDQIGFKGFITSDWGATHATDFINAGLDMEMPGPLKHPTTGPSYFARDLAQAPPKRAAELKDPVKIEGLPEEPPTYQIPFPPVEISKSDLLSAVKEGTVSEDTITRAAGRILYQMDRFGMISGNSQHRIASTTIEEDAKVIRRTGEEAAVLLKNNSHALPLRANSLKSIAFIGPGAAQLVAVGRTGEKAVGLPSREVGPLQAVRELVGKSQEMHLTYAAGDDMEGTTIPSSRFFHDGKPGLQRLSANGIVVDIDRALDFSVKGGNALPPNSTFTWHGTLTVPESGDYRLHLQMLGCFAALEIDGKREVASDRMWIHGDITQAGQDNIFPTTDGLDNIRIARHLTAGEHAVSVMVIPDTSGSPVQVRLNWVTPSQQKANYQAAVAAARTAGTAVVFAWSRGTPVFALPGDQDRMIEDIAAVNPNTMVVLNVSQPVAMPWLDKVRAVLLMWWPGDEGGWATADILLGRSSPAGRLPFTWGRRLEDYPATDPSHPERSGRGVNGKTIYSEGVLVGYRWFDKHQIEPLFPFGYGLSYSKFKYSDLQVSQARDGGADLRFQITNTGDVESDEVAQAYLGAPRERPAGVQFSDRILAAFTRVHLAPGQSLPVLLHISQRQFQYWSTASQSWRTPGGEREVFVGASSRDLRLKTVIP